MSIALMGLVWDSLVKSARMRLILLAIADSANDDGACWPSVGTLAKRAGCSLSTARGLISELEQRGVLTREVRNRKTDGGQTSNMLQLNIDMLRDLELGAPPAGDSAGGPAGNSAPPPPETRRGKKNPQLNHQIDPLDAAQRGEATPSSESEPSLPEDGGLFDPPEKEKKQGPEREPAPFSAKDVVATYVDSFRTSSPTSSNPPPRFIKQVGREAKSMIEGGTAQDVLLRAAAALGQTTFASLERQVAIELQGGKSPARGMTGTRYNPAHWDAQEAEERDENGHTAEDRYLIEHYGATVTYGHQK